MILRIHSRHREPSIIRHFIYVDGNEESEYLKVMNLLDLPH